MKKDDNTLYKIKEFEKLIIQNLSKPIINDEMSPELLNRPTPTQMRIVGYILENIDHKDIYQKNIEEALNLSKATVSDVLNRMEKNGLIERQINKNDTRTKRILLKGIAKECFEGNKNKLSELEKKATKNITSTELENFSNVLNKMIINLKE